MIIADEIGDLDVSNELMEALASNFIREENNNFMNHILVSTPSSPSNNFASFNSTDIQVDELCKHLKCQIIDALGVVSSYKLNYFQLPALDVDESYSKYTSRLAKQILIQLLQKEQS
jgi:hypothetical protein